MFGIPIWIIQLAIAVLKATGAINAASALSLKLIVKVDRTLSNLKIYHQNSDFPDPYPGQISQSNIQVSGQ